MRKLSKEYYFELARVPYGLPLRQVVTWLSAVICSLGCRNCLRSSLCAEMRESEAYAVVTVGSKALLTGFASR